MKSLFFQTKIFDLKNYLYCSVWNETVIKHIFSCQYGFSNHIWSFFILIVGGYLSISNFLCFLGIPHPLRGMKLTSSCRDTRLCQNSKGANDNIGPSVKRIIGPTDQGTSWLIHCIWAAKQPQKLSYLTRQLSPYFPT